MDKKIITLLRWFFCSTGPKYKQYHCNCNAITILWTTIATNAILLPETIYIYMLVLKEEIKIWYIHQDPGGTKIFQYCTCPAGRVTYNFHSSCKHLNLSIKRVYNKEHKGVIWLIKFHISLLKPYLPSQFHNCIPYTDKKISQSILIKC